MSAFHENYLLFKFKTFYTFILKLNFLLDAISFRGKIIKNMVFSFEFQKSILKKSKVTKETKIFL
jgi:hypothetical protein